MDNQAGRYIKKKPENLSSSGFLVAGAGSRKTGFRRQAFQPDFSTLNQISP